MKIITWFGTLDLDGEGKVVGCDLFPKDPELLSERLIEKIDEFPPAGSDLRQMALECGFVDSDSEYDSLLRDVGIRAAKIHISRTATKDMRIIQAVEALDDIDENANALSERLAEWYGLYFPELDLTTEALARFIAKYGSRSNVPAEDSWFEKASSSMGAEMSAEDEELIKGFAKNICGLYDNRSTMENYILQNMATLAPNLANIAGPLLGARLISMTGGLKRLAGMPSSTVQVIGANRALFKHLRGRAPSPKHGIIFNNPLIKNAPWWQRGKIARAFAARITMAARIDLYSGELNESLKDDLESKIERIKLANPSPPKKKKKEKVEKKGRRKGGKR